MKLSILLTAVCLLSACAESKTAGVEEAKPQSTANFSPPPSQPTPASPQQPADQVICEDVLKCSRYCTLYWNECKTTGPLYQACVDRQNTCLASPIEEILAEYANPNSTCEDIYQCKRYCETTYNCNLVANKYGHSSGPYLQCQEDHAACLAAKVSDVL
jgi:hypothetical protein